MAEPSHISDTGAAAPGVDVLSTSRTRHESAWCSITRTSLLPGIVICVPTPSAWMVPRTRKLVSDAPAGLLEPC